MATKEDPTAPTARISIPGIANPALSDVPGIGGTRENMFGDATEYAKGASELADNLVGDLLGTVAGDWWPGDEDRKNKGDGFPKTPYYWLFRQPEGGTKQYSETPADKKAWTTIPTNRLQSSYSFVLIYRGVTMEIPFNINPRRETVTEPHASTTTMTQGGGKIITSEGSPVKEIVIEGTTGLYPNQGNRKVLPTSGVGSGFESFKMLQNVFRKYAYLKRYADIKVNAPLLVYVNNRRQEQWIVNPKSFVANESSDRNFLIDYTITLETLYPYTGKEPTQTLIGKFMGTTGIGAIWNNVDGIVTRVGEGVDQMNATLGKISAVVDGFTNEVFTKVMQVANPLADLVGGRLPNFASFKRDLFKDTAYTLRRTFATLELNKRDNDLGAPVRTTEQGVTAAQQIDQIFITSSNAKAASVSNVQDRGTENFIGAYNLVAPEDALDAGNVGEQPTAPQFLGGVRERPEVLPGMASYTAAFSTDPNNISETFTSIGQAMDINRTSVSVNTNKNPKLTIENYRIATPPSYSDKKRQEEWGGLWSRYIEESNTGRVQIAVARVQFEESPQTCAFRLMSDESRWPILVMLNDLKYPYFGTQEYIDTNLRRTDMIAYGSYISYPKRIEQTTTASTGRTWRTESKTSPNLSAFERTLGSDIFISADTGDAVWVDNDIRLIEGIPNLEQFIRKRTTIMRGLFRRAPNVGFSRYIGETYGPTNIAMIKAEGSSLLDDDERTVSSEVVSTQAIPEYASIMLGIEIKVKNMIDPLIIQQMLDLGRSL